MSTINQIFMEVTASKKYAFLHEPLIMRICAEEYPKYKKEKDIIKAVKNRLHLLYGAFYSGECHQKASRLLDGAEQANTGAIKNISMEIMSLHASTNTRLPVLAEFYDFIFSKTGNVRSILDIGCGFNPFSIPWMPSMPTTYHAYDIDRRTSGLLNRYFTWLGLPSLANDLDIVAQTPRHAADIAFLFQLIPVLESQQKKRGFELIQSLPVKYLAITYPIKSLSGKEKGMKAFYSDSFERSLDASSTILAHSVIGHELVYVVTL